MKPDLSATVGQRVVRLPTAQPRQVQQPCNKAGRAARAELREQQALAFHLIHPQDRAMDRIAASLQTVHRSPELAILLAILGAMEGTDRARVQMHLSKMAEGRPAGDGAVIAADLVAATTLATFGQKHDLDRAIERATKSPTGE